jgi:ABC transporter substrate binding protein
MDARALVDLKPYVLAVSTVRLVRALQEQTRTIPIVIVGAGDPLASGLVASLARPEGNTTGITDVFPSIAGKAGASQSERTEPRQGGPYLQSRYLESRLRKDHRSWRGRCRGSIRNVAEIERAIPDFALEPNGGLIIVPPQPSGPEREAINRLALRHRLPSVYQDRSQVAEGGLLSYGADMVEMSCRHASAGSCTIGLRRCRRTSATLPGRRRPGCAVGGDVLLPAESRRLWLRPQSHARWQGSSGPLPARFSPRQLDKTNSIRPAGGPHPNIVISQGAYGGGRATAGNPRDLL